mgnify:CR=1 FL=1
MAKIFYTDRDIEDLAAQGVTFIEISDDVVLTDLAVDKARRFGIDLIKQKESQSAPAAKPAASSPAAKLSASPAPSGDMESRVFTAVKKRLGDQVDDALLRTIVKRVIASLGKK